MSHKNANLTDGQINAKNKANKKKKSKIIKTSIIFSIIILALLLIVSRLGLLKNDELTRSNMLTTYTVGTRTITEVLTSSGTIEPNDQYTINALVSGEIIADYFEEGDTVTEDQLLYEFDSDSLNSGVTRATNSLKSANNALNDALENLENLDVESDVRGIIKKLYIEVGDEINAGTLIADVVDNETMCIDVPFMAVDCKTISVGDTAILTFDTYEEAIGTVTEISSVSQINSLGVSVRNVTIEVSNKGSITTATKAFARVGDAYCTEESKFYNSDEGQIFAKVSGEVTKIYYNEGDKIYDGNIIAKLESEDLEEQIDKLRDTVTEAENSLNDANDAYDNYNIEAPITGKVISKSYKAGDTLSGGQGNSGTLAVIYDMSALKFTMNIDELDIDKLDKGQEVIVTCDSREGEKYYGTITNISIQGSTNSGTTIYPVEVKIDNVEDVNRRTVDQDGTVNKVYKTGMTSTEKTYSLLSTQSSNNVTEYIYSEDIKITKGNDGNLYDNGRLLKPYINGTFTQGSGFYTFSNDFSTLILEVQNDKKMLRPGMNIDAEIIVENRENVISVPLSAVGRGNVVKVIKTKNDNETKDNNADVNSPIKTNDNPNFEKPNMDNISTPNAGNPESNKTENDTFMNNGGFGASRTGYGTADIDSEYEEVRVTVGISDDDFVEITSGLNVGDTVILDTANLASGAQNMQFGMMGGMGAMGGMNGGNMMGGGRFPSGGMGAAPMGR